MQNTMPWLSLAIWIPIVFGVAILGAGRDRNPNAIRTVALVGSLLGLRAGSTRPRSASAAVRRPAHAPAALGQVAEHVLPELALDLRVLLLGIEVTNDEGLFLQLALVAR